MDQCLTLQHTFLFDDSSKLYGLQSMLAAQNAQSRVQGPIYILHFQTYKYSTCFRNIRKTPERSYQLWSNMPVLWTYYFGLFVLLLMIINRLVQFSKKKILVPIIHVWPHFDCACKINSKPNRSTIHLFRPMGARTRHKQASSMLSWEIPLGPISVNSSMVYKHSHHHHQDC
jgi:hypothetical protein